MTGAGLAVFLCVSNSRLLTAQPPQLF